MTNIFKRIQYTIEAELHNLLDKKQAQNPIAMLNQYVREAEKQTKHTGELLARQAELKREMENQLNETTTLLAKRTEQVELATATGDAQLIAFANDEVTAYSKRKTEIEQILQQVEADYFMLEQKYEAMKHKIADMTVRQLSLMGKENTVRAEQKMNKLMMQTHVPDFDEMDTYIDQLSTKIEQKHNVTTLDYRLDELTKKQMI